jgi:Fe-S cluster assembly protein SufD
MSTLLSVNKLEAFRSQLSKTALRFSKEGLNRAEDFLSEMDFPTTKVESWKYTRLNKISGIQASNDPTLDANVITSYDLGKETIEFIFQNGVMVSGYSEDGVECDLPDGLTIIPLEECSTEQLEAIPIQLNEDVFSLMNTVYCSSGLYIDIRKNTIVDKTIHIQHIVSGKRRVNHVKHYLQCGTSSNCNIVMTFVSEDDAENCMSNVVTNVHVGENAHLTINKLQLEDEGNFGVFNEFSVIHANGNFTLNTFTLGGTLIRNNTHAEIKGQHAECNLNGAYLLKGSAHVDNHTLVEHQVPNCNSNELYKGVMDDKSTGVFNGKVIVHTDAQKTNAFQSNANVLLTKDATINSKPELEIYADDVKCSHGSTTGQLDENAVFYLRARGVSETSARQLLVQAFIEDVLDKVEDENVVNCIHKELSRRFDWTFN